MVSTFFFVFVYFVLKQTIWRVGYTCELTNEGGYKSYSMTMF